MDDHTRSFIEQATLLFIASRNGEGAMDVSPRGGQPSVVRLRADGCVLLPDYIGNKRLDTIGNILSNPDVALLLINRNSETYLRIAAYASVSQADEDIAAFPADENRALSVMVLKPGRMEFVASEAFRKSGFWVGPSGRKPPLDALDIYFSDKQWQAERGRNPVLYDAAAETRLADTGIRAFYGTPSPIVQTKVYDLPSPGFMGFINDARFVVFAHEGEDGEILIELAGHAPLRLDPATNQPSFLLEIDREVADRADIPHSAQCALLAAEPGRCDALRLNGTYREVAGEGEERRRLSVQPQEIYFHCSAAFTRSRIWSDSRAPAWAGLRSFTCVDRRQESPDVVSFLLKPRDDAPVGNAAPGQFITVSLPGHKRLGSQRRCYSISGMPDKHTLRISVRRVGNDGISAVLHDGIAVGDELRLGAPAGHFVFDSDPHRPVVLVSAGVGITPLLPMAEHLAREGGSRDVLFIHAARSGRHHLFVGEAQQMVAANPAIRLLTIYSRPEAGDSCHHEGRLDAGVIARHVSIPDADFYICGPDSFMSSLEQGLIALGAAPGSLRTEVFEAKGGRSAAGTIDALVAYAPCNVEFAKSSKRVTWRPESGFLLDLALANGVEIQYSCRSGECQSCAQRIVSGRTSYPTCDEEPVVARGQVLMCQAIPRNDIILDC
ncbi:pyridoxamine 5'-phosphate oxidase family protein [Rhizobium terrae]|uniref:pyridoxamine 5'-phosphate oxidase family protein n=1 Tax=Rhizobium terrae TaxID=2171756 RepID=UPI0013C34370|nr:pyridoxamine 5'-phosphate oxidase family protein [Rhizobium terrae]